jgi:surface-anchored protein
MSLVSIWNQLRNTTRTSGKAASTLRRRSQRKRRAMVEQLESRRLLVAELVNFLTAEHVDINLQRVGSEWALGARNSDEVPAIQYANDEAILYTGSPAEVARPAGSDFDFIGVDAGQTFYLLPQSQNPDVLYLGFAGYGLDNSVDRYNPATESKGRVSGNARWAKASLADVRHTTPDGSTGTGVFSMWQSGAFGGSVVFMASYDDGIANPNGSGLDATDGISADDAMWIVSGGHSHFNFGFTEPGRYEIDFKLSAYFGDDALTTPNVAGFSQSEDITIYFSVMSVGELQFDSSSYSVNEGDGTATIDVIRAGGSDGRITVDYATSNGTATAGADFTTTSGVLEFLDGETVKSVVIPILEDSVVEEVETFNVVLAEPSPANLNDYLIDFEGDTDGLLGVIASTGVTIFDSEGNLPPTISDIADSFVLAGNTTGAIPFTVGDTETAVGDLIVAATSSNQAVIPDGNIMLGGSGAERTIEVSSLQGQVGSSTITVTVTDAGGLQASDSFLLTVTASGLVPFEMPTFYGGTLSSAFESAVSDFNGDGHTDLITSGGSINTLAYFQGTGDGGFLPAQRLSDGMDLYALGLSAVDYDQDGDVDLIAGEFNAATQNGTAEEATITLYQNNGTGQFSRVALKNDLMQVLSVATGDFNNDGRPDVVWTEYGSSGSGPDLSITGSFSYALQSVSGELGATTTLTTNYGSLLVDDVNGDGNLDIVARETTFTPPSTETPAVRIHPGNGDGTFGTPQSISTGTNPSIRQIVDLNGDGRLDILMVDRVSTSRVGYYPQQADGSFGARVGLLAGVTQVNAIRAADINQDGVVDIVAHTLGGALATSVHWTPGLGEGLYGTSTMISPQISNVASIRIADLDGDSYPDVVATGDSNVNVPGAVAVYINKTDEDPMVLVPPAAWTRSSGDTIDMRVFFGFPITVTGTPRIELNLGGTTVYANYLSGSGTPTLTFRYTVTATDLDLDGVQLASNLIDLNGGALTDPIGGAGVLEFPETTFDGVIVNARGPLVQMVSRLDSTPTVENTVRFSVQFAEEVTDVDMADFTVRMTEGDLVGAEVVAVTGSGSLYEVTVSTGTGSGTLGLSVNDAASIFDLSGDVLAKGYPGGQVYTVRQQSIGNIDNYYTDGHADYRTKFNNGEFAYDWTGDSQVLRSDEVITYLDSTAIVTRPTAATYDFLGVDADAPLYLSNSSGSIASVPFLGFNGESLVPDTFANYRPSDPRITSATLQEYVKVEMVGMRSSDGDFSVYSIVSGNPRVWMASSDGFDGTDNIWLYRTHFHRNVAFSKPGTYEIDIVISGYLDANANNALDPLVDTYVESGIFTMVFHVDTLGARDDAFQVNGQETLHGSVMLNDQWDDGIGAYTASVQSTAAKGTLSLQPNGSFTYEPSATFDGTDSFTYRLTNPRGGFTTATVAITRSTRPDFVSVQRTGHADIGVNFEDGDWDLHIHDHEPDTEYEPDEAMFYVGRDAMLTRTGDAADPAYDFLGAPVGSTLFVLPEVENSNLLFLGIGGEELAAGQLYDDFATLQLISVSGPGDFSIWQSGLTPSTPNLFMATADGIDNTDVFDVAAGSHAHVNFGFSKQGVYEVTFVASGIDADGNATDSGPVTYYFYVTDGLVPFAMPSFLDAGLGVPGFQSQLADFNGDGKPDMIVAGSGTDALGYRQGVGDGSFLPEQSVNAGTGLSAQGIVAVDYDVDGDMDFVALEYVQSGATTEPGSGAVTLFRNDGTGSFTRVVLKSGLSAGYEVDAGDLNGDGRPDLVYNQDTSVAYALQQPSGELGAETVLPATLNSISGVQLGDMDNDGDVDIVVGNRANNPNAYFSVFSNDGNAIFGAPQNKTTGIFPDLHALADLNGDGRLDVVTGESVVGSRAGYYPQLTDGTFGSREVVLPTNTQLNSLTIADINGDGIPDIAAGAIVGGRFSAVWSPGLGGGTFGATILIHPNEGNAWSIHVADLDADNYPDILTTGSPSTTAPSAVRVYINKTGESPMVLMTPAARTRVAGDPIELSVYYGFPITVAGTPRIALDLGGNTVYANYVSGTGTPTLTFRYMVTDADLDLDGVQLASNVIDLNGGTLTNPLGGAGVMEFPSLPFNGVIVNGRGPLVQSIVRLDSRSTTAETVRFNVQFAEAVTGVDTADFAVRMNTGDLVGAAVTGVTGSGNLYEVTVSTGTGSGTLGLSVLDTVSIFDLSGDVLAKGYAGGEVYTVRKQPLGEIDVYYTDGHADYRPVYSNGQFEYLLHADPGVLPETTYDSDEVYTYADSSTLVTRAGGANYDFLGVPAGQQLYVLPTTNVPGQPYLGLSGESLEAGVFARYRPSDPRITSSTLREYVKVQMVDMRSSSDGEFSLYSGSAPTVWMASSDGISENDSFWLYRTHFHRSIAFSKPGIYEIDVVISGYLDSNASGALDPLVDTYVESGIFTMVFNVDTLGARDDAFEVNRMETLRGSVTLNDLWAEGFGIYAASVQSTTTKGELSLQPNGSFTYQPSAAFDGSDSFTYRLTNSRGGFTTATATITAVANNAFIAGFNQGHGDLGIAFEAGQFDLHLHIEGDEHEGGEEEGEHDHGGLEYSPNEMQIQLGDDAAVTVPNDPAFQFLGSPGSTVFVLPTINSPELPFLGIATEEIEAGTFLDGHVLLHLKTVSGPGDYSLWGIDSFGAPVVHLATADGVTVDDQLELSEGTHAHFNMGFSQPGFYAVTFDAMAVLADGVTAVSSGDVTYYFAVVSGIAPVVTLASTSQTYTEQSAAKIIDSSATVTDADSIHFGGGFLRVDFAAGGQPDDQLAIQNQGVGVNQISVSGNQVAIGVPGGSSLVIGTLSGGSNGEPMVVEFNANAAAAHVTRLLRSVTFHNLSDNPTAEHRLVRFVIHDGANLLSDAAIREIEVTPLNDAPLVMTSPGSTSYEDDEPAKIIDGLVLVMDSDSTDFDGGILTVTIAENAQETDRLLILPQGNGPDEINLVGTDILFAGLTIGSFSGGFTTNSPLEIVFNANATSAAIQQLARQIAFVNVSASPSGLTRVIDFVLTDGDGGTSQVAQKEITHGGQYWY